MFCPKCGSPIENDHSYCSQCGCSLEEWGVVYHPHTSSNRNRPYWFYVVVILTFVLMVWGFYAFITGADMLATIAKSQLEEIKTNKLTKAYYEHTSTEFRKENNLEEFKSFVESNSALKNFLDVVIVKSEKDKKYGVVFLKLSLPGGLSTQVKFEFVEEDGEWRVLGISFIEPIIEDDEKEIGQSTIIESVKSHLSAMRNGNLDKAYAMGAKEFLEATKVEGFKNFVKEHSVLVNDQPVNMSIVEQEGNKALVRVVLYSNGVPVPIDYIMVDEGGSWKVWSFYILKPINGNEEDEAETPGEEIGPPIEAFIEDLRNSQNQSAYEKTAEEFQETTSIEQFKEFLKQFPVIKDGQATALKSKVSGDVGQARYKMKNEEKEATVDFILTKENGDWKILGIQFIDDKSATSQGQDTEKSEDFDSSFLTKTISDQVEKIKQKDFYSAYEDYTSLQFRKSTPFDSFARFVQQNSVFSNNRSMEFGELTFNNNVASVFVNMISQDGARETVEFDLVKENESWKIQSIRLVSTDLSNKEKQNDSHSNNEFVIEGIDVGTEVNLSGQITNPSTKIKSTASEIFATLFIKHGERGVVLEVFFEHLDTNSSLPPVVKTLKDEGDSPISLVFTPPKGGWPVGKYLLKAKASTGEEKDIEFEVIE